MGLFARNFCVCVDIVTRSLSAHITMGLGFGNLHKSRGIVAYRLSPFEQRAFAGITKAPLNFLRRIRGNVFTVAPPFIVAYLVYNWGEAEYARLSRKNPADFANDV